MGSPTSLNQRLDTELITLITHELNKEIEFITIDEKVTPAEEKKEGNQIPRPPVVAVMGHIDHGKTSLLDYIRKTKVTDQEAGHITQHIGAYQVQTQDGNTIVFLDTPGHETFTAVRAHSTQATDIVVIIVAADEKVMPQTIEAIHHAQQASLPIIIAINKIDKPAARPEKIKKELAAINITIEEWGGRYQCQPISAKTGEGIEDLLKKIWIERDLMDLKADPSQKAEGIVIESTLDKKRGYLATLIVLEGTLKMGDPLLVGPYFGKVKAMHTPEGKSITQAPPATPVQVLGLNGAPGAGQNFRITATEKEARQIASKYKHAYQEQGLRASQKTFMQEKRENLFTEGGKTLHVLIKADTHGSAGALADALLKLSNDEMTVKVIFKAVGPIAESDILLASSAQAIIIGYHTDITKSASAMNKKEQVAIHLYNIIYQAIDHVTELIAKSREPEFEEQTRGKALVLKVFSISRLGNIAGCQVKEGTIQRNHHIRLIRNDKILHTGTMKQLKREKDVIKEAKEGSECGIHIDGFNDIQVGDIIESFERVEKQQV